MQTFLINQWNEESTSVHVRKRKYKNGRTALELIEAETGEPYAVATVNIPEVLLTEDELLIKDYSENQGILDFLVQNRIVRLTGKGVESGFVWLPVCELLPESQWGTLEPPPDKIDTISGKKMWKIKDYEIWADNYSQALDLLPLIEDWY